MTISVAQRCGSSLLHSNGIRALVRSSVVVVGVIISDSKSRNKNMSKSMNNNSRTD